MFANGYKEELEEVYLSDKVTKVLDDYDILYGDIVENGDGSVNIVGVDEDEWDEVVVAIKDELGLDVLVPDENHDELDNELIVKECLKENKKHDGTCPHCHSENIDFVDEDEESVKYICRDCGEDFIVLDDETVTSRNGKPIEEEIVYGLYVNKREKPIQVGSKEEIESAKKHLEEVAPEDSYHRPNKYVVRKIGATS